MKTDAEELHCIGCGALIQTTTPSNQVTRSLSPRKGHGKRGSVLSAVFSVTALQ